MAVLVTLDVPVGSDNYDALITQHQPLLRRQPGFRAHYAHPSPDGFTITEVWDSERDYAAWYDGNIRPHQAPGVEPTITKLHSVVTP